MSDCSKYAFNPTHINFKKKRRRKKPIIHFSQTGVINISLHETLVNKDYKHSTFRIKRAGPGEEVKKTKGRTKHVLKEVTESTERELSKV